jgi:hypothetical protein
MSALPDVHLLRYRDRVIHLDANLLVRADEVIE